jgi:hypothetical protein
MFHKDLADVKLPRTCDPHYNRELQQFLDDQLPGRWVGGAGPIPWPPRSPDLNPLDFFFGGGQRTRLHSVITKK